MISRVRVPIPSEQNIQLHRNTRPELYDKFERLIFDSLDLNSLSRYPDVDAFIDILCHFLKIDRKYVFVTSAIDGAIKTIFDNILSIKPKVAILTPTYKMYEVYAEAYGANLRKIHSRKDLNIDINEVLETLVHVEAIFIPNPHEPVENVFTKEQIVQIVQEASKQNVLVVLDEAYYMFGAPTVIDIASQFDNLIVMRSFSKAFGLPAIRLGYMVANEYLIAKVISTRMAYESNTLSMKVAECAINNFDLFQNYIDEVKNTRSYVKDCLESKGFKVHGSYSNTVIIDMGTSENAVKIFEKLKGEGIIIRELSNIQNVSSWVSVTIGKKKTMNKFLNIFLKEIDSVTK